jgi:hypothetical protein
MRVAVIGFMATGGLESYATRIANVLNKTHTSYAYPTQNYPAFDGAGMFIYYKISELLGKHLPDIEYIIVVQSKIFIHNDTDIPLLLFKTESVVPEGTVDNPTLTVKKLEEMNDYDHYDHVIASAIAPYLYRHDREKDIFLLDVSWLPTPWKEYIEKVERAQHLIVMQRYHDIDIYTARVIEAMACKTIPIIFYNKASTKEMYESIGIDDTVAYFVNVAKYGDMQIKQYDIEMAEKGYKLVIEKFNMNYHVKTFMELLLKQPKVNSIGAYQICSHGDIEGWYEDES